MVSEQSQAGNDRLLQTQPSGGAGSSGGDLGATAKDAAQDLKDTAQDVMQQTKETAGQVVDQAKEQATNHLDNRKDQVVESVGSVADALRHAGKHLRENEQAPIAQYADKAADRVEQFAHNLRGKDVQEIMRDVEDYARRQPALVLGGAFVLGLLAARFLKSTAHRDEGEPSGYQSSSRGYSPSGYGAYRGGTYRGSRGYGYGSGYGSGRSGSYGGSYETSGRPDYYGGEPNRDRGYAAGATNYGADRTRYGVDAGPYQGGMSGGTYTGTGTSAGMGTPTSDYGTSGQQTWNAQGRETR